MTVCPRFTVSQGYAAPTYQCDEGSMGVARLAPGMSAPILAKPFSLEARLRTEPECGFGWRSCTSWIEMTSTASRAMPVLILANSRVFS